MLTLLIEFMNSRFFFVFLIVLFLFSIMELVTCILAQKNWRLLNQGSENVGNSLVINKGHNNPINLTLWPITLIIAALGFIPFAINHHGFGDISLLSNTKNPQVHIHYVFAIASGAIIPLLPKFFLRLVSKNYRDFLAKTGGNKLIKALIIYRNQGSASQTKNPVNSPTLKDGSAPSRYKSKFQRFIMAFLIIAIFTIVKIFIFHLA